MTDKELIQALRHCASDDEYGCLRCPGESTCDECTGKSLLDAADRLESLLAENERLKAQLPKWRPVSEPPEEYCRCLAMLESGEICDGSYVPSDKVVCEMASDLLRQLQQPYESEETP